MINALAAAGRYKFAEGAYKEAAGFYQQLVSLDKANSQLYVPKLVIALSHIDPDAAATFAKNLPEIPLSTEEIDIEKLENVSLYRSAKDSASQVEEARCALPFSDIAFKTDLF